MNQFQARSLAAAKFLVPNGIALARRARRDQRHQAREAQERASERARAEAQRARERERRRHILAQTSSAEVVAYSHPDSMAFLIEERGLDPVQVAEGSIPLASLEELRAVLRSELPADRPLVGLHVGNFVGVSLAYLTDALVAQHAKSVVVSVDAGTTHRRIQRPQEHVLALLDRYGLGRSHIFVQGFSLLRAVGHENDIPSGDFADLTQHHASEGVLDTLVTAGSQFDVALLDDNHEGDYLQAEIERVHTLLGPGGVVVLDDVEPDGPWVEVFEVFERTKQEGAFELVKADGRIAVFRRV